MLLLLLPYYLQAHMILPAFQESQTLGLGIQAQKGVIYFSIFKAVT